MYCLVIASLYHSLANLQYFFLAFLKCLKLCGQSYKQFTLVNYDCSVALTRKLLIL